MHAASLPGESRHFLYSGSRRHPLGGSNLQDTFTGPIMLKATGRSQRTSLLPVAAVVAELSLSPLTHCQQSAQRPRFRITSSHPTSLESGGWREAFGLLPLASYVGDRR